MDWNNLRYLLAVARAGTIAAAARQLGVSHSTVYRKVKAFEDEHEVTLFQRHADGYRLTEAGATFVALTEQVEGAVAEVGRGLRRFDHQIKGKVTIAAPEAVALLLCPRLAGLLEAFPKLTLEWQLDADVEGLVRREADIAIAAANEPPPTLVGRRVADVDFAVYGAATYLDREGITGTAGARWIVFDPSLAHTPVAAWERAHVSDDDVAMRVNRRVMLDEAVLAGLGVGVMPAATGDANPRLRRLSDPLGINLPLWVLTHADLREAKAVRAVFDQVVLLLGDARDSLESAEESPS